MGVLISIGVGRRLSIGSLPCLAGLAHPGIVGEHTGDQSEDAANETSFGSIPNPIDHLLEFDGQGAHNHTEAEPQDPHHRQIQTAYSGFF